MEKKEEVNNCVSGPEGYAVFLGESTINQMEVATMGALQAVNLGMGAPNSGIDEMKMKKKRGRPRKFRVGPDGTIATALSPMPISASIPLSSEFSTWKQQHNPPPTKLKPQKFEFLQSFGDQRAFFVGTNFTTHVITVNAGEDVAMKILSFSPQDPHAICVLSASGSISNVSLCQPNFSGGTLTYEGCFEILSLSGSFMPTEHGLLKSRSGGMSVSLASPDGRVLGGGLAGLLIAASPVQVVLGSFMVGKQLEQKLKKQRMEKLSGLIPSPISTFVSPFNREPTEAGSGRYGGQYLDPLASMQSLQDSKDVDTDNLTSSSPEGESNDDSPSRFNISG